MIVQGFLMKQNGKRNKLDKETTVFILFLAGMAVYYGWRMFALTPWYDELYTYYYFISRGPVYAAIHWPLPNNHIGYSVLSACLGIFGNAYIALRGVSWLCSLGSMVLLFRLGRKCFAGGLALMPVFLYTGMKLVNQLAVQGRGYALVSFCYLAAVCALLNITAERKERFRDYVCFGMSLVLALYAIPSSLYVVLPVCLAGGIFLLARGEYGRLGRLILTALAGAACTAVLYGLVWLAIGSNLLTKTEGGAYYGMGHAAIILQAPFTALKTGIDYMLATPYIQSVGREGFFGKWTGWMRSLFHEYYAGGAFLLAILLIICIAGVIFCIGKRINNGSYRKKPMEKGELYARFLEIYLAVTLIGLPLMMICLHSLPYYRVFSFAGAAVALAVTWLWQTGMKWSARGRLGKYMLPLGSAAAGILCIGMLATPGYRAQYSEREAAIQEAYAQADLSQTQKVAVTDCDQEYLLLFLCDIGEERITRDLKEAEIALADKYLLAGYDTDVIDCAGDDWKLYLTREEFAAAQAALQMEALYENDRFILYSIDRSPAGFEFTK